MFDQDLLRTFVAIVEAGSFAGAARAVGRTTSAVSMQVKRLEQSAGRRLLSRGAHGVALTSDGEVLLAHARAILEAHEAAMEAFAAERAVHSLAVGLPGTFVEALLAPLIGELVARHPDTHVRIVTDGSGALARRLEEASLDLALLTEFQLGGDERGVLVHVEHGRWASANGARALGETPLPVALMHEGSVWRRVAQEALRRLPRPYRVALTTNSEAALVAAVAAGAAVAPIPASRLPPGLSVLDERDGFPATPPLRVRLRHSRRRLPPAGEWLVERLVARGRELE